MSSHRASQAIAAPTASRSQSCGWTGLVFGAVLSSAAILGLGSVPAVQAADLVAVETPAWTVENPVTADLYQSTASGRKQISMTQIDALQQYQTDMLTPWEVEATFEGVLLDDLIDLLGIDPAKGVRFKAIDDYVVVLFPEELGQGDILFVTRMNGQPVALEDKGPFRLMWPGLEGQVSDEDESTAKWIWAIEEIGQAN